MKSVRTWVVSAFAAALTCTGCERGDGGTHTAGTTSQATSDAVGEAEKRGGGKMKRPDNPAWPTKSPLVGKPVPTFRAKEAVTGQVFHIEDFRGRIVLLDFWQSGTDTYAQMLPLFKKAYETHHDSAFDIVSINLDAKSDDAKAFIERERMGWYHVFDHMGRIAKQFDIQMLPRAILIDPSGVIVQDPVNAKSLSTTIERCMKETPPKSLAQWSESAPEAALARAEKEVADRKLAAAVNSLELITNWFPESPHAKTAEKRLAELRANPETAKDMKRIGGGGGADKGDSKQMAATIMTLARGLADGKKYEAARGLFKRVIEEFPDTEEAKEAQKLLETLPE